MTSLLLQAGGAMNGIMQIVPLLGIFVVFYFFMIRPQQKRQKQENDFRSTLKKGDEVKTIGGMYGTVDSVDETSVILRLDATLKVRFDKSAIVPTA